MKNKKKNAGKHITQDRENISDKGNILRFPLFSFITSIQKEYTVYEIHSLKAIFFFYFFL